jgi:YegS/Rv2252/BmrU family lipid kinase
VIIVLNTASGTVAENAALRRNLEVALHQHGVRAEILEAGSGQEVMTLAERAARSRVQTVVAAGGDGTVNAVASALLKSDKRLGVLPLGTLNHFSKDLGIPQSLDDAVQNLVRGSLVSVDVGEVNDSIFLNNSSLGLYPRIVRHRDQQRHQLGRGKWPAFAWAVLSALHVCPILRLRLRVEGRDFIARTPFLFVGNNAYSMETLRIGARDRLDAGVLGVYFARGARRLDIVALACRSLIGRVEQAKTFEMFTTKELQVETRRPSIDVSTDGEVTRLMSPLVYRVRAGALRVIGAPSKNAA